MFVSKSKDYGGAHIPEGRVIDTLRYTSPRDLSSRLKNV
jgi:hypothetical protein